MGLSTHYYLGYHVKVETQKRTKETTYLRKHCGNNSCEKFKGTITGNFCEVCGTPSMESMTPEYTTVMAGLPDELKMDERLSHFYSDDGKFIYLIPNYMNARAKFGLLTEEFDNAGVASIIVPGFYAEEFDEFREYYASYLQVLDDAGSKYAVEYGIVKYYY